MRPQRKGGLRWILVFFLLVGIGAFYVFERIRIFELVNQVERLKEEREKVQAENEGLKHELTEILSREAVEGYAMGTLHMRYPFSGEVVELGR